MHEAGARAPAKAERYPRVVTASRCCVCSTAMRVIGPSWCRQCPQCGTLSSSLPVDINGSNDAIDEDRREAGLANLRATNNEVILQRLHSAGVRSGSSLLDVGCGHGWFVGAALDAGIYAEGLEPDGYIATRACAAGAAVRTGFFPHSLDDTERFDVITFNDVLEHFPDPGAAISAACRHLSAGGLLSINIPSRSGLVYRIAHALRRAGLGSVFDRLWQVGLPSPHLWFFDRRSLVRLCQSRGLTLVSSGHLQSVSRAGLWSRARLDGRPSLGIVMGVAAGWLAEPLLNSRWGSDIMHVILRKPGDDHPPG